MPPKRGAGPRTLAVLLQAMEGTEIAIELKSDHVFLGVLETADRSMKCGARAQDGRGGVHANFVRVRAA